MITPLSPYDNVNTPAPAYDPLRVAAYTGGFGTMPSAQYLTPAGYGAYRQLPGANMTITPNMQPGFLTNAAIAMRMPFTYNPAVNPMVYRAHAARRAADEAATYGLSAMEFGVSSLLGGAAGAAVGGGGLGLATGLAAPMLLPIGAMGTAVASRIREARALQQRSMAKITSGRDLDLATGMGFSSLASANIDRFIRKRGADDFLFKEGDYRNIMHMGMETGLFDYAGNSAEQYKTQLKKLRNTFATAMSVLGSTDFKDILKDLKRLQNLGVTVGQMGGMLRREEGFARMAGMTHGDLMSTYGQAGAVMATTHGLAGYVGSLASAEHAAAISIARQNGLVSPSRLAALGGESGYITAATESTIRGEKNIEMLIASAVANDRGTGFDYNRMADLIRKSKTDDKFNLAYEAMAARSGRIDAATLQNLQINAGELHKHFRDVAGENGYREFWRNLIRSTGNMMFANDPNATEEEKMIAGYRRLTGASAQQAAITVRANYLEDFNKQNRRSEQIEFMRKREEERERDRLWNRIGVGFSRFVNKLSDATIGGMATDFMSFTDKLAGKAAGVGGFGTDTEAEQKRKAFGGIYNRPGVQRSDKAASKEFESDKYFNEAITGALRNRGDFEFGKYNSDGTRRAPSVAGKQTVIGSEWSALLLTSGMEAANAGVKSNIYDPKQIAALKSSWSTQGSVGIFNTAKGFGVDPFELGKDDFSKIKTGTIIYSRDANGNINGSAVAFKNAEGKMMLSLTREDLGVGAEVSLEDAHKHLLPGKNGTWLAQDMTLMQSKEGQDGSPEWQAMKAREARAKRQALNSLFAGTTSEERIFYDMTRGTESARNNQDAALAMFGTLSNIRHEADKIGAGASGLDILGTLGIRNGKDISAVINKSLSSLDENGMRRFVSSLANIASAKDQFFFDKNADILNILDSSGGWKPFIYGKDLPESVRKQIASGDPNVIKALAIGILSKKIKVDPQVYKLFSEQFGSALHEAGINKNRFGEGIHGSVVDSVNTIFSKQAAALTGESARDFTAERKDAIAYLSSGAEEELDPKVALDLMTAFAYHKAYAGSRNQAGLEQYDDPSVRAGMREIYKRAFKVLGIDVDDGSIDSLLANPEKFQEMLGLNKKTYQALNASAGTNFDLLDDLLKYAYINNGSGTAGLRSDLQAGKRVSLSGKFNSGSIVGRYLSGMLADKTGLLEVLSGGAGNAHAVLASEIDHFLGEGRGSIFYGIKEGMRPEDKLGIIQKNAAGIKKELQDVVANKGTSEEERKSITELLIPYLDDIIGSKTSDDVENTIGSYFSKTNLGKLYASAADNKGKAGTSVVNATSTGSGGKDTMFNAANTFSGAVNKFEQVVNALFPEAANGERVNAMKPVPTPNTSINVSEFWGATI